MAINRPVGKSAGYQTASQRWDALAARDPRATGSFYYGVKTTGVYCKPACRSRLPNRRNVEFFSSRAAAEAAGYRPCKRCAPDGLDLPEQHVTGISAACKLMRGNAEIPAVSSLARAAGMSRFHFQRVFRRVTGLTPKAYQDAVRNERVRETLLGGKRVTHAIYDAGFKASSRFYEKANQILGMDAKDFRNGGNSNQIEFGVSKCSLGKILVAASEKGVCAILLGESVNTLTADLRRRFSKAVLRQGGRDFHKLLIKAIAFVEQPGSAEIGLPLDVRGTAFQQKVWAALRGIKAGETTSYSNIARRIGRPDAVRAVAGAIAANPIAVIVPCHRVLRADGSLCGYRWGTQRKQLLLKREKSFLHSDKEQATAR